VAHSVNATKAYKVLDFASRIENPMMFLFGSVDSLIQAQAPLFEKLNNLPFYTYINIGLESVDQPTLKLLGKPLIESSVR
jgi:hypothetical protein